MNAVRFRRNENIRRLVIALGEQVMGPADVVKLLQVSDRAARYYLDELKLAGIGSYEPTRRSHLRINRNLEYVQEYLQSLEEGAEGPGAGQLRDHRKPCRDPLVAALFGVAKMTPTEIEA